MSAERWQRLRELYDAVTEAPADRRQFVLDELRGTEEGLLNDLLALLAADQAPETFLDTPIARLVHGEFGAGAVLCDRFEVRRRLGQGGMGEVWAAYDRHLQEDVAIKTIRAALVTDRGLARFKREIQLARRIAHPNVCRVYELFEDAGVSPSRFFLTMELLEGETLAARLKRDGAIPPREAIDLVRDVVEGLAAAHEAGVVHRDLKPANIMLVTGGSSRRVAIMDFGLARSDAAPERTDGATVAGILVGTPEYMAPEQISDAAVSPATDIYAMGLILFEVLHGAPPFAAGSTIESWMRRAREGPQKLSGSVPGVPGRIDQIIARCLQYDSAQRFQNARELLEALTLTPALTLPMPPRRVAWTAAAVVGAAMLAGAGAWIGFGRAGAPPPEALRWYEDAQQALAEGASVRALSNIERAIGLAPRFAPAQAALAEISLELDMPGRAQEAMLRAGDLARGRGRIADEDRQYMEGMRALVLRDCDPAIAALKERARLASESSRPYRMVSTARAMERCDRLDAAMQEMAAAAALDPRNAAVPLRTAWIARQARDVAMAMTALDQAEALFRDRNNLEGVGDALTARGTFETEQDRLAEAELTLVRAAGMATTLGNARQQIRVLIQQAIVSRKRGDVAAAIELTNRAIDLGRQNNLETLTLEAIFAVGNIHLSANRFREAEAYFERASAIAEEYRHEDYKARAAFSMASAATRVLQPERAQALATAARAYYAKVNNRRNLAVVDLLIGQIHLARAQYADAIRQFESTLRDVLARQDREQEASARENLATALAAAGQYPEALTQYEAALAIHNASARRSQTFALLNVADTFSRLGQVSEARRVLTEARRTAASTPDVQAQLLSIAAGIELRRGKHAEALALARRSIATGEGRSVERELRAQLIACAAGTRSTRTLASGCEEAHRAIGGHGNLDLRQESWLTLAEAYLLFGRRWDAAALLREVDQASPPLPAGEQRIRYLALTSVAGADTERDRIRADLTRELDALRLKWQAPLYRSWLARADVRQWLDLASVSVSIS